MILPSLEARYDVTMLSRRFPIMEGGVPRPNDQQILGRRNFILTLFEERSNGFSVYN